MGADEVELRRLRMPLTTPFRSSHGVVSERDVLLVRVDEGWAECVAPTEPTYTEEYVDGAHAVLRDHLVPRLFDGADLDGVAGHRMAKAALRMAVVDDGLRRSGRSLAMHMGAVRERVPAGIALGIPSSMDELLEDVAAASAEGYQRVKLKIRPGWDVAPVKEVRAAFGDSLALQVDANGAYGASDPAHVDALVALDGFGLLLIEQPFAADDLVAHAGLARRLNTPVCLDESVPSAAAASAAIAMGACSVVNVKPGRVGGLDEAVAVHDVCVAAGVAMWVGGMSETGLGRAANCALAAMPGFTMVGDLSASARWFPVDITEPFVVEDGTLPVPTGPGAGVELRMDVVESFTTSVEVLRRA